MTDIPSRSDGAGSRLLLAAGGTGGHIYPAIALGRAWAEHDPHSEIHYICGDRPGELDIYRRAGIEPIVLPFSGHRPGLAGRARFVAQLWASWRAARGHVRRVRPDLAVGFGSYVPLAVLWAAGSMGVATAIHEQNAHPGRANRLLARRARLIMTGVEVEAGIFNPGRTRLTGNPVRPELLAGMGRTEARRELGLPGSGAVALVQGGSQGALGVNRIVREVLGESPEAAGPAMHWLWATGPAHFDATRNWLEAQPPELQSRVHLSPYQDRMDLAYAAADLAVTRAGALTIAELTALGKPAILIPLPTSAGGHQLANARRLESAGAAAVIEQRDPEAAKKVRNSLEQWTGDCVKLAALGRAARALGRPDAAGAMVRAIVELALPEPATARPHGADTRSR